MGYRSSPEDLEVLTVDSRRCSVAAKSVELRMDWAASYVLIGAPLRELLPARHLHVDAHHVHLQLAFPIPTVGAPIVAFPLQWCAPRLLFGALLSFLISSPCLLLSALLCILSLPHEQVVERGRPRTVVCTQQT